jgi:hypothetical protein
LPHELPLNAEGRLLLYSENNRLTSRLANFPVGANLHPDGSHSAHYSPLWGSEYIVIAQVSGDGKIHGVERVRYGALSFYEGEVVYVPKFRKRDQ